MTAPQPARWARFLPALAVGAAGLFAVFYLGLAAVRVAYPYDLDFVEDGMLLQAWQSAQGRPVFVPPNADFGPNVYMPLYTWLGGLLLKVTGLSYWPLRLISLTATVATAGLVGWSAQRESGRPWLALACAGLFLGGNRLTGFWYELVRVDALYVTLAFGGFALGVYGRQRHGGQAAAAAVLALAFFTKQTAVIFAGALAVVFLLTSGRRAWLFPTLFVALTAGPYLAFDAVTGGWFGFHTFGVATADPIELGRVAHYLGAELWGGMGAVSAMAVAATGFVIRRSGWRFLDEQPWLAGLAAGALVSGLGRASVGGNLNNLMPVYAFLCLAPALLARGWLGRPSRAPAVALAEPLLAGLVLLQFALGVYNPWRYAPTSAMRAAGDRLVSRLRAVDGEVLVLMHPYYAVRAGKAPATQIIHLWYYYTGRGLPWPDDFAQRLRTRYYAAIVSDESLFETEPALKALIDGAYVPEVLLSPHEAPPTTTGMVVRPRVIYRPRPPDQ